MQFTAPLEYIELYPEATRLYTAVWLFSMHPFDIVTGAAWTLRRHAPNLAQAAIAFQLDTMEGQASTLHRACPRWAILFFMVMQIAHKHVHVCRHKHCK